jgi:hypothetical protein
VDHEMAQLSEALRYKPEGHGFNSRFFNDLIFPTVSKQIQDVPSGLCLETVIKTCMKITSAECTVENS